MGMNQVWTTHFKDHVHFVLGQGLYPGMGRIMNRHQAMPPLLGNFHRDLGQFPVAQKDQVHASNNLN